MRIIDADKLKDDYLNSFVSGFGVEAAEMFRCVVNQSPTVNLDMWIPCSVMLPDPGVNCLVTAIWEDEDMELCCVFIAIMEADGNWYSPAFHHRPYKVTAWQPLPRTYRRDERCDNSVIEMLKEMQIEAAKCQGFVIGHVTQLWVVQELLGKKIKELGGEPYCVRDGRLIISSEAVLEGE